MNVNTYRLEQFFTKIKKIYAVLTDKRYPVQTIYSISYNLRIDKLKKGRWYFAFAEMHVDELGNHWFEKTVLTDLKTNKTKEQFKGGSLDDFRSYERPLTKKKVEEAYNDR